MSYDDVVRLLNEVSKENEILKRKVYGLKSELIIWKEDANGHIRETNELFEINEQLQKRNDRQRERLDELYQLILNRDYDGQEELIKEFKESERLLQKEMECYR